MKPQKLLGLLLISIILVNISLFFQIKLKEKNNELLTEMYASEIRFRTIENDINAMEEHYKIIDKFIKEFSYSQKEKENVLKNE